MADIKKARSLIKDGDVKFIRLTWCDTANMIRAKAIHARKFDSLVEEGFGLCTAVEVSISIINDAYNLKR